MSFCLKKCLERDGGRCVFKATIDPNRQRTVLYEIGDGSMMMVRGWVDRTSTVALRNNAAGLIIGWPGDYDNLPDPEPPKLKTKTVAEVLGCVDGTTVEEREAATLAALRAIAEAHNYLCDKQCFPTCKVDIETVTIPAGEGE